METTWDSQLQLEKTRMLNQQMSQKDLLIHFLNNRKDVKLNLIIHLVFMIFGFDVKKLYYKITKILYNEKLLRERCKFLNKCRFYHILPNHLHFITKNIKKNHMFSHIGKVKQKKLLEKTSCRKRFYSTLLLFLQFVNVSR